MTARHRGRLSGAYHALPKNGGQWLVVSKGKNRSVSSCFCFSLVTGNWSLFLQDCLTEGLSRRAAVVLSFLPAACPLLAYDVQ